MKELLQEQVIQDQIHLFQQLYQQVVEVVEQGILLQVLQVLVDQVVDQVDNLQELQELEIHLL